MEKRRLAKGFWVTVFLAVLVLTWYTGASAVDKAIIEAAKKEGKFVWYTSMPTEPAVDYLKAFQKKYPFLDVSEFFRSTSLRTWSRIQTEYKARKAIADAIHIAIHPPYLKMVDEGWLLKYNSPVFGEYPKGFADPGYYAAMRCFAVIGAYNKEVIPSGEVPKTWKELTNPKWKGKLAVEPASSGAQALAYYTVRKVLGEGFWKQIGANKPKVYSGTGASTAALLRGEIEIAICSYGYAAYRNRELKKSPVRGIWFKEGVPRVVAPLGILENAPHPNAAKLFLEWALSKEGQTKMVELVGAYSARPDVPSARGNPPSTAFKSLFVEDMDDFMKVVNQFPEIWKGVVE
jgi:iron(III) transport system substrate-binding protein